MAQESRVEFIERIRRTPTVESFRFMPEKRIEFKPGQFLQVMFAPQDASNRELNKFLSFSSSVAHDYIEVTKRLSGSAFSNRLRGLKIGDEVTVKAPMGECVLDEGEKKVGFLIGGIGITPVVSMLEYISEKKLDIDVSLFYSNRVEEEIAFKEELDDWQDMNPRIRVVYTVTDCRPRDKRCVFGRIDKNLIMTEDPDFTQRTVFIFGPPKMVEVMKSLCIEAGTAPSQIRTEKFIGY